MCVFKTITELSPLLYPYSGMSGHQRYFLFSLCDLAVGVGAWCLSCIFYVCVVDTGLCVYVHACVCTVCEFTCMSMRVSLRQFVWQRSQITPYPSLWTPPHVSMPEQVFKQYSGKEFQYCFHLTDMQTLKG